MLLRKSTHPHLKISIREYFVLVLQHLILNNTHRWSRSDLIKQHSQNEMQFPTIIAYLTFFSLFHCLCNGVHPDESSSSSSNPRQYSAEEEWFIIDQMRNYPIQTLPIWGSKMWKTIAKNHCKLRESNPYIYPARTHTAIGRYFQKVMVTGHGKVELPDDLINRIPKLQKKAEGDDSGTSNPTGNEDKSANRIARLRDIRLKDKYTSEEDEFIINFVKNYRLHFRSESGEKMWIDAAEQFNELRKSDPSKFPQERSAGSLRERLRRLSQKPENKSWVDAEKATEKSETLANRLAHLRDIRLRDKYTLEEDEFIINFVKNYPREYRSENSDKMWTEAAEELKKLQTSDPSKFPLERSAGALRERLRRMSRVSGNKTLNNKENPKDLVVGASSSAAGGESTANKGAQEKAVDPWDVMVQELIDAPYEVNFAALKDR